MIREVVFPGAVIGILGGGQLGRMIAIEARKMGYGVICLDPTPRSPCGQVADDQIIAPLDDLEAAVKLAERTDVIVYEFENVDLPVVQTLEKSYNLPQGSRILSISQCRREEKTQLKEAGFPVVPFRVVRNQDDLERGAAELGYPCILKTSRGGYDGKGQMEIRAPAQLKGMQENLRLDAQEWILEKRIPYSHEISVILARKRCGETVVYPVGENIHRSSILHLTVVPARVLPWVASEAVEIAKDLAHLFEVVGLLAVEFFVTDQGVVINEIAPRPHNSGHYTWDACYVSQFENLIRAVCGLPLGSTELLTPVVMANILSADVLRVMTALPGFPPNVKVRLYGKRGVPNPKRKMGHLTIRTDRPEQAIDWINTLLSS